MTTIVAAGFISRRTAVSQSRVNASYSAKSANLSQVVVDPVDHALVGTRQRALELEVVGRIGEDEID